MKNIPVKLNRIRASTRAIVDDEDYAELMKYKWYLRKDGYARRVEYVGKIAGKKAQKHFSMHRQILGVSKGESSIDHVNGNRLDNRKENLRFATPQQNSWNISENSRRKSGSRGVHKAGNGFQAMTKVNGKNKHLGYFSTEEKAAECYETYIKEKRGVFFKEICK